MSRKYDYEQAHKTRFTDEEKARILKVWNAAKENGGMTILDIAKRFQRSHKSMTKLLRDSGALNNEQSGDSAAGVSPLDAPDVTKEKT